ncbi:MAG TPA: FHA domain-containing protein [Blastocatellia bacterium]|nr:FHA domain-containing protein [Blastocatellia bacterium]
MIRCDNCGTNNVDGSDYCDECGMKLDLSPRAGSRKREAPPVYQPPSAVESDPLGSTMDGPLPAPPSFTTSTSIPKPAMPARERKSGVDSRPGNANARRSLTNERSGPAFGLNDKRNRPAHVPQTYALSSPPQTGELDSDAAGNRTVDVRSLARLIVERGGRIGKEFPVNGIETNIGRWDADSGIFPDVDLDEDDSEAKVSRRHARIVNHNGQFFIEDLGSTNGTFVNRGRRLLPGKRHMLQNGDEIIVGKTFLKFQILK